VKFLLIFILLFSHLAAPAQLNKKKLDSLSRDINNWQKEHQAYIDSFKKAQDSIMKSHLKKPVIIATQPAPLTVSKDKEPEPEKKTGYWLPVVLAALLILLLAAVWYRRNKNRVS
jgi:hypothetical protein